MSHQPNIFLFSTILGLTFVLLDVYVLRRWTQHAQKRNLHAAWYQALWAIAAVMLVVYCYVMFRRHFFRMDGLDVTLFGFVTLWYLPKMGIALVLLPRDAWRGALRLSRRFKTSSTEPAPPPEQAPATGRREFLGTAAWSISAVPYLMVGRGMWSTLYDFQVMNVDLVMERLPRALDGMRIAQLSDIHAGSFPDHTPFQEVRYILESIKPDAILITGDFVNQKPEEMAVIAREFAKLRAPYGVYASLGNHDHYNSPDDHARLVATIRDLGTELLINQHKRIGESGSSLIIAGTDNTGFRQSFARLDLAMQGVREDEPVILLAHDPTFWDKEVVPDKRVDVMVSGHTHGGQFGVQALGVEWSPAQMIYKQWAGLYTNGDQQLYVNRGIGTVGPPLRIGIPPEITLFTLRAPRVGDNMV
jgi:predicted MPP superfamily phosphohydrolase